MKKIFPRIHALTLILLFCGGGAMAKDLVKAYIGESTPDQQNVFKREILKQALDITTEQFSDYDIKIHKTYMNPKRGFQALLTGNTINVYFALTLNKWEEMAEPIRIPLRKGLVSYRLLLVNKNSLHKFKNVESVSQLKALRAGLNEGWTTYEIMKRQNFKIVKFNDYEGMLNMLKVDRYDYLLRGVNEIFNDAKAKNTTHPNLVIEPNLAINIPSATYIFVSKKAPRLAQRLKLGLKIMIENGQFDALFNKFFEQNLRKAKLHTRKIIRLDNPLLPETVPLGQPKYWFKIKDYNSESPD